MIWLKYAAAALIFFISSLLQASFFPYFSIMGATPSLVFTLFFLILFFEHSLGRGLGLGSAIIAGIISDMFLSSPFGVCILAFLAVYFLHALIGHFFSDSQSNYRILYFIAMFCVLFVAYYSLLQLAAVLFGGQGVLGMVTFINLAYSLVFATLGFYAGKTFLPEDINNQLKLL